MYATDQLVPLVAKSNAGMPQFVDGLIKYSAGAVEMAEYAVRVRTMGARIIGGCCGSSPEHIRAMVERLQTTPFEQPVVMDLAAVAVSEPRARRRESRRREG
jgi:hypothetical protein